MLRSGWINILTLRAKVDDARPFVFLIISLNGPLAELTNLFSATQTRQVSATENKMSRAVFAAGLIDECGIRRHSFAV